MNTFLSIEHWPVGKLTQELCLRLPPKAGKGDASETSSNYEDFERTANMSRGGTKLKSEYLQRNEMPGIPAPKVS